MSAEWLADAGATANRVRQLQSATFQNALRSAGFLIKPSVLRVFQLDGMALEREASSMLRTGLTSALSFMGHSITYRYEEEINLALTLVLFKLGMWDGNQFYGDRLQNVVYRDETKAKELGLENVLLATPKTLPSAKQKLLKLLFSVLIPYFLNKVQKKALEEDWASMPEDSLKHKAVVLVKACDYFTSFADFVNLLWFLRDGQYRCVADRVIGLRLVHGRQRMARVVNLAFLTQHIFYNTVFSFMSYILPLLKLGRIWRILKGFRGTAHSEGLIGGGGVSSSSRDRCTLCGSEPMTLPRRTSCRHGVCYYCASSRTVGGSTFSCPDCGHTLAADDIQLMPPVTAVA